MPPSTQVVEFQLCMFGEPPIRLTPLPAAPKDKREPTPKVRVIPNGDYRDSSHGYRPKGRDV